MWNERPYIIILAHRVCQTNVTSQRDFHRILMNRLFGQVISPFSPHIYKASNSYSFSRFQVDSLIEHGARQFLFLTVPPTNRAPLLIDQGHKVVASITGALADYNNQLVTNVKSLPLRHRGVTASVFDTRPIFNTLLDNADTFGFVNSTGFCEAYQNGTPDINTQIPPCAPVSSYL